jgi:hypothetical protein
VASEIAKSAALEGPTKVDGLKSRAKQRSQASRRAYKVERIDKGALTIAAPRRYRTRSIFGSSQSRPVSSSSEIRPIRITLQPHALGRKVSR